MKVVKGKIIGSNVIGVQKVKSKKNGNEYGILHLLSSDEFVTGFKVETAFLPYEMITSNNIGVGSVVDLNYNSNGFIKSVTVTKSTIEFESTDVQ